MKNDVFSPAGRKSACWLRGLFGEKKEESRRVKSRDTSIFFCIVNSPSSSLQARWPEGKKKKGRGGGGPTRTSADVKSDHIGPSDPSLSGLDDFKYRIGRGGEGDRVRRSTVVIASAASCLASPGRRGKERKGAWLKFSFSSLSQSQIGGVGGGKKRGCPLRRAG